MKISIEVKKDVCIKFPFIKLINHMVSLVPNNDKMGLEKIIIRNDAPGKLKSTDITQAYYYQDEKNKKGYIEVLLKNIIHLSIPDYAFEMYTEIGGLLFSEIIFHKIGHHVHFNKRHGLRKKGYENFADQYAKAGYFAFLKSRSSKILSSYKWAGINIFYFNKEERHSLLTARQELIKYLSNNKGQIVFP